VSRDNLPANSYRQSNDISPLPRLPETIAKISGSRSAARACTSCRMAPLRENRLACSRTLTIPTSCRSLMLVTGIASKKPGYVALSGKALAYCATCSNLDLQRVGQYARIYRGVQPPYHSMNTTAMHALRPESLTSITQAQPKLPLLQPHLLRASICEPLYPPCTICTLQSIVRA
jgi:hypothetical protein